MEVKRAHNLSKRQNIYNIRARKKYFLKKIINMIRNTQILCTRIFFILNITYDI